MQNGNHILCTEEREQFWRQGYLGPYTLCNSEEMLDMQPAIERVLETDAPDHKNRVHNRHLDSPVIHNLAHTPSYYQTDGIPVRTRPATLADELFRQRTGSKGDSVAPRLQLLALEPPIIISAWIAIDSATLENSCLQIVPGSHRKVIPHVKATSDMAFNQMGDLGFVDTSNVVNLEMQPGEFVLFNERTLHHSEANRSDKRRIGLAVRVILPIVKVFDWDAPQHELIVIHGEDPVQFNKRS